MDTPSVWGAIVNGHRGQPAYVRSYVPTTDFERVVLEFLAR
jgi:hypothetical protein